MQGDVRQKDCGHPIFQCYKTNDPGSPILTTMHCSICGLNIQASSLEQCIEEWKKWKDISECWEIPWKDLFFDGAEDNGAVTIIVSYDVQKSLADIEIEKQKERKRTDEINRMAKDICGMLHNDCNHCGEAMYRVICDARKYSARAYAAGYRKSSEEYLEEEANEQADQRCV